MEARREPTAGGLRGLESESIEIELDVCSRRAVREENAREACEGTLVTFLEALMAEQMNLFVALPMLKRAPARDLEALPTLATALMGDLKLDVARGDESPGYRVWLARTTRDAGTFLDHHVTVEVYLDETWVVLTKWEATP